MNADEDQGFYGLCDPNYEPTHKLWLSECVKSEPMTLEMLERAWEALMIDIRKPPLFSKYTEIVSYSEFQRRCKEWGK